jgi:hypothetical protein
MKGEKSRPTQSFLSTHSNKGGFCPPSRIYLEVETNQTGRLPNATTLEMKTVLKSWENPSGEVLISLANTLQEKQADNHF